MTLKLVKYNEGPPGGYRYKDPDTATWIRTATWPDLLADVRKHRRANNLPIGLGLDEQIESQLCATLPPEWTRNSTVHEKGRSGLTFGQLVQGTLTMAHWLVKGREIVPAAESEQRARICVPCFRNDTAEGCKNCNKGILREAVNTVVGKASTPHDEYLEACTVCGCELKAKVHVPLEILQQHTSEEQNGQLPEWCWLRKN